MGTKCRLCHGSKNPSEAYEMPPTNRMVNACAEECENSRKDRPNSELDLIEGDDGFPFTAPVGSKPEGRSRDGLEDMAGNVKEWTSSWYGDGEDFRRVEGGSWASFTESLLLIDLPMMAFAPVFASPTLGARCAKTLGDASRSSGTGAPS